MKLVFIASLFLTTEMAGQTISTQKWGGTYTFHGVKHT